MKLTPTMTALLNRIATLPTRAEYAAKYKSDHIFHHSEVKNDDGTYRVNTSSSTLAGLVKRGYIEIVTDANGASTCDVIRVLKTVDGQLIEAPVAAVEAAPEVAEAVAVAVTADAPVAATQVEVVADRAAVVDAPAPVALPELPQYQKAVLSLVFRMMEQTGRPYIRPCDVCVSRYRDEFAALVEKGYLTPDRDRPGMPQSAAFACQRFTLNETSVALVREYDRRNEAEAARLRVPLAPGSSLTRAVYPTACPCILQSEKCRTRNVPADRWEVSLMASDGRGRVAYGPTKQAAIDAALRDLSSGANDYAVVPTDQWLTASRNWDSLGLKARA